MAAREKVRKKKLVQLCAGPVWGWRRAPWDKVPRHKVAGTGLSNLQKCGYMKSHTESNIFSGRL